MYQRFVSTKLNEHAVAISVLAELQLREEQGYPALSAALRDGFAALEKGVFAGYEPEDGMVWDILADAMRPFGLREQEHLYVLAVAVRAIAERVASRFVKHCERMLEPIAA